MKTGMFLEPWLHHALPWLYVDSAWWTAVGLVGNLLFSSRFLVQWWSSERRKHLHVPDTFWHLSFWGGLLSFVYALHIDKLPVILSTCFLPFLYGRNLVLLRRRDDRPPAKVPDTAAHPAPGEPPSPR